MLSNKEVVVHLEINILNIYACLFCLIFYVPFNIFHPFKDNISERFSNGTLNYIDTNEIKHKEMPPIAGEVAHILANT